MQEYVAIDLPGKILYKKEFNTSIRKITPIEQKYIISLSQKEQKTNKDYINFLKKLVSFDNPEMTFEELFWFDVQYILYRLRFITYSRYPIKLEFNCLEEDCNTKINREIKPEELNIVTPDDLEGISYKIDLDVLGNVDIRNKTINDDIVIDNFIKQKGLDPEDLQMRLLLLDLCLVSNGKSLIEMYDLAEQGAISAEDIVRIEEWFTKSIWGVKEEILVKCPKCGKEEFRGYILSLEDFFSVV